MTTKSFQINDTVEYTSSEGIVRRGIVTEINKYDVLVMFFTTTKRPISIRDTENLRKV